MPTYKVQIKQEVTEIYEYTIQANNEEQARETAYSVYDSGDASHLGVVLSSSQWTSDEYNEISSLEELISEE